MLPGFFEQRVVVLQHGKTPNEHTWCCRIVVVDGCVSNRIWIFRTESILLCARGLREIAPTEIFCNDREVKTQTMSHCISSIEEREHM